MSIVWGQALKGKRQNGSSPVTQAFQCSLTTECANDSCFFRQRDVHGLNPWWINPETSDADALAAIERQREVLEVYGPWQAPSLRVSMGTNVLYAICDDFEELDEKDSS